MSQLIQNKLQTNIGANLAINEEKRISKLIHTKRIGNATITSTATTAAMTTTCDTMSSLTSFNVKRMPLAISFKQNKSMATKENGTVNVVWDKCEARGDTKASKTAVNDENSENCRESSCENTIGVQTRSRIPVDALKQMAISKINKSKQTVGQKSTNAEMVSFSSNLLPVCVENIDLNDANNVFLTPDYVNEIYSYLRHLENIQNVKINFLSNQREMTPRMRSVLIDWLINVHNQFRLLPETLYLAVSIMDRFFQNEIVSKDKIQLVGVTSFFIASKFEEIYPPDVKDFVLICDQLYHKRDIIKMEMTILRTLKFELGRPLPLHFLRRNSKAAHADSRIHALAKYLMELTLVEYECAHWNPSYLAATALYVTLKILGDSTKWTPTLEFYSNYSEQNLLSGASLLCKIIKKSEKSKFQNCRKKYSTTKLLEISKLPQLKSPIIYQMASIQS